MSEMLSAENSALLLIDHQVGTKQLIKNIPLEVVKRNTLALCARFVRMAHATLANVTAFGRITVAAAGTRYPLLRD